MSNYTALITGATGLVGHELVHYLLSKKYYSKIKVLTRRKLDISDDRLEYIVLEDFGQMERIKDKLNVNDYYCALGTTMKKSGSKENFKKIDLEYPLMLADIAQSSSAFEQYLIVTAAGSKSSSPLFYNKIKGKLEDELKKLKLKSLTIFQPSFLLGHRDEFRLGEAIGKVLSKLLTFFMVGSKKGLFAIPASDVAKAMYLVAVERKAGTKTYKSSSILKLAKSAGI